MPATRSARFAGDAAHHLVVAASIVSDGDLDVRDQYASRVYRAWHPRSLRPAGKVLAGRMREPQGMGLAGVIAPAYALGGAPLAAIELGLFAAAAFVLAALLARRIVPEPWATLGAGAVGLSPLALGNATAILPGLLAGGLLVAAILCALALGPGGRGGRAPAIGGGVALAVLPWLDPWLILPAIPVAVALVHRAGRGRGFLPTEIMLASLVFGATLDDGLYGGVSPRAAAAPGADPTLWDRLGRIPGLWLDRGSGLLRWAPVLALAGLGAWLLWRSRREGLARVLPARAEAETAAGLALAVCVAQAVVAVVAAQGLRTPGFAGASWAAALPAAGALCAWGLRRAPRIGGVLVAVTLAGSAWLLVALRTGSAAAWNAPPRAPWGPLTDVWPQAGTVAATVTGLVVVAILAALAVRERRRKPLLEDEPGRVRSQ